MFARFMIFLFSFAMILPEPLQNTPDYICCYCSFFLDSNAYAHFVFNAFDKDKNGSMSFEVGALLLGESHCIVHVQIIAIKMPQCCC